MNKLEIIPTDRPNILLLLTDQQRFDTLSADRNSFKIHTPNMDRLVRRGVTFQNAFCSAPVCAPSRASMLTGLHPTQAGVPGNLAPPLNEGIGTIADRLQADGYETVYHGKSHLKGDLSHYGFETVFENSHDATTRLEASRFYRNHDWVTFKRPFFHVVSFLDPHDIYFLDPEAVQKPFLPPWQNGKDPLEGKPRAQHNRRVDWPEERWQYYRDFYRQRVERVDNEIGLLIDELFCSGFGCNTWIIFASDHGDMGGEHGIPFKGAFVYDGVMRVPLVIAPPDVRYGGKGVMHGEKKAFSPSTCDAMVSLIDIAPTILDLAGVKADSTLPGKSLLPAVQSKPFKGHDAVFTEWNEDGSHVRCIRTADWKYSVYLQDGEELYDLKNDPLEIKNLVTDPVHAPICSDLRKQLADHLKRTGDPFTLD